MNFKHDFRIQLCSNLVWHVSRIQKSHLIRRHQNVEVGSPPVRRVVQKAGPLTLAWLMPWHHLPLCQKMAAPQMSPMIFCHWPFAASFAGDIFSLAEDSCDNDNKRERHPRSPPLLPDCHRDVNQPELKRHVAVYQQHFLERESHFAQKAMREVACDDNATLCDVDLGRSPSGQPVLF